MGADGRGKRREWLHEAIDFIRVFAYFVFANHTQKRLKYGYFEQMLHPVFSSPKSAKLRSVSLETGTILRGGLYWKGY
jgi:hypothetical protein